MQMILFFFHFRDIIKLYNPRCFSLVSLFDRNKKHIDIQKYKQNNFRDFRLNVYLLIFGKH